MADDVDFRSPETEPPSDPPASGNHHPNPTSDQTVRRWRALWETSAVGLLLGLADSNHAGNQELTLPAYFIAGFLIGLRHAGRACPCWPLLGVSLYAVHIVAIACGRKPPYVEENYRFAEQCLWAMVPSGLGIMAGAGFRVTLRAFGWFRRKSGPPARFLPRTTRDVMVAVACVAIGLGSSIEQCSLRRFTPKATMRHVSIRSAKG